MKAFKQIAALLLALPITLMVSAQISLAPSFVFVEENSGVGNVYLTNNSDKSYEVSVNFVFGYPQSDSIGNMVMNYNDSVAAAKYALDPMIRAFPRSLIMKAGEQKTVRIQVIPGQRRKEGYFFTRMKVLAKPQTADVTDSITQAIGTKINFNFEQITAVFYHKGKVNTGLEIQNVTTEQKVGKLFIRPFLHRIGNAPFLGSQLIRLKDSDGKTIAETQSTASIYFDMARTMEMSLEKVTPGTYSLELTMETRRNDMMITDLIQTTPIKFKKTVIIQ